MTNEPIDELYLEWLYSQIGSVKVKNLSWTYWSLCRQLFKKEFVWFVPNDDNRVEDGRDLRHHFISETHADVDRDWMEMECSFLELLIGLARRLAFEAEGEPRDWFWLMLRNLGLDHFNDAVFGPKHEKIVDEAMDRVIWRRYSRDGDGGLFPLRDSVKDQRKVELWYQLNAYIIEND